VTVAFWSNVKLRDPNNRRYKMKFSIAALFIAVVAAAQVVSCQGRYPRALKAKLTKKTKRKSSKRNVKKVVNTSSSDLKTDEDDLVVNTSSSDLKTVEDDLVVSFSSSNLKTDKECTKGDDRSNGFWMQQCKMCLPQNAHSVLKNCYCARNAGVDGDFDIYFDSDQMIQGVFNTPINGGQWYDRCRECRTILEAGGIIAPGATCNRVLRPSKGLKMQLVSSLSPLWKHFGPHNYNDVIRREPRDCRNDRNCKLLCGKDENNDYQMHIDYFPQNSENGMYIMTSYVHGLPWFNGKWVKRCNICGENLQLAGFIKSGWSCQHVWDGVKMNNIKYIG